MCPRAASGESPAGDAARGPSRTKTNTSQAGACVQGGPLFTRGLLTSLITDVILFRYSGLIKLLFQKLGKKQTGAIGSGGQELRLLTGTFVKVPAEMH
jgi:hypothetical protein